MNMEYVPLWQEQLGYALKIAPALSEVSRRGRPTPNVQQCAVINATFFWFAVRRSSWTTYSRTTYYLLLTAYY